MTERVIAKALAEGYNVSVEGTFRTADVPMKTLDDMRRHGYETAVYIQTTPAEVSWQSTLERYEQMDSLPLLFSHPFPCI
nr:zeta toxin family protein [Neisseria dumasiana]